MNMKIFQGGFSSLLTTPVTGARGPAQNPPRRRLVWRPEGLGEVGAHTATLGSLVEVPQETRAVAVFFQNGL